MKALVGAFNQEKDLVGAFSVIVQPINRFAALVTSPGFKGFIDSRLRLSKFIKPECLSPVQGKHDAGLGPR